MENSNQQAAPLLAHLQQTAIQAHNWTSHWPEKRGEQMIAEFSSELAADLEELGKNELVSPEAIADYKERYTRFFTSYLHAKGRCISSFITGPARFPVRRAEKANRSEENHYRVFREWRSRAKKSIVRKSQPAKTYSSELDRYRYELESCKHYHEKMKACNAIIKRAKGANCTEALIEVGLSHANATKIQEPDFMGRTGFASFNLTNNNANMKRIEGMIKLLEQKEAMLENNPDQKYTFDGGEAVVNYEADRIQIFFAQRPTREELSTWKQKGLNSYNWSPSSNAWQRKITNNALYHFKSMMAGKNLEKL